MRSLNSYGFRPQGSRASRGTTVQTPASTMMDRPPVPPFSLLGPPVFGISTPAIPAYPRLDEVAHTHCTIEGGLRVWVVESGFSHAWGYRCTSSPPGRGTTT